MELLNLMITNINLFTMISNHETWGINTDLFETNIINLSVVIGLLIFYGRITFTILRLLRNFNRTCSFYLIPCFKN
jgi:hypothetical protein